MMVLDLDPSSASHLVRALEAHRLWCRTNGYGMPEALDRLASMARGGQDRTSSDDSAAFGEAVPMPLALGYDEAARLLSVSERTIRRLVASGELASVTLTPNTRRILRRDLEAYAERLAEQTAKGA